MSQEFDVTAVGHAIVDVLAPATEAFIADEGLPKGGMTLIDQHRAINLYDKMVSRDELTQESGGSAGNTIAGVASFGGKAAYIGKVAHDELGEVFSRDLRKMGVSFETPFLHDDPTHTARCLINITEDGQRTMATFLGAAALVGPADVDPELIKASQITYLEGYLFDTPSGRAAFAKACEIARSVGRKTAITLSDSFVVDRWRTDLMAFIEQHIDLVFANESELLSFFQTDDFYKAVRYLKTKTDLAFITRSEKGSVAVKADISHDIPVYPVQAVVDTTGAGDQYAAGVLYGLTQGLHLETCGRLGALAAAEVISHYGPRPQVSYAQLARDNGLI
ncbi:adenosine kinase [Asticcacaulis sp. BYS171W]|uniref:Adenosine kinase n=1 Tax=Asticcacaulis aquaticus TaxID=2984212 RepID=A0ABT5HTH9_9CAUL|nr:adenosine kinase [Asticcacaulis aquaticus]MDC7683355.1 adenosine kinase [Asticcacaulis aquaticus]